MNTPEHDRMEAELRKLKPAKTPVELMARLEASLQASQAIKRVRHRPRDESHPIAWWRILRWLAPASAVGLVIMASLWQMRTVDPKAITAVPAAADSGFKPDDVQINRKLVAAFDAVASLPDGEPVRFRCREWSDALTFHDSSRGVVVEQRTPRLEIIPIGFETY